MTSEPAAHRLWLMPQTTPQMKGHNVSKTNGKGDTATAAAAKRTRRQTKVILQKVLTIQLKENTAGPGSLDYYSDLDLNCADLADAHKQRKERGGDGAYRIIRVLDEFTVAHEQVPKETITRSGQ